MRLVAAHRKIDDREDVRQHQKNQPGKTPRNGVVHRLADMFIEHAVAASATHHRTGPRVDLVLHQIALVAGDQMPVFGRMMRHFHAAALGACTRPHTSEPFPVPGNRPANRANDIDMSFLAATRLV